MNSTAAGVLTDKGSAAQAPSVTAPRVLGRAARFTRWQKTLLVLFLLSLPFVNPWVRGDGVGYYAYLRSMLIDQDLRFENDFRGGNASLVMGMFDSSGRIRPAFYTPTGHVENNFSVGPAMLWAPFVIVTHAAVLASHRFGGQIPADGFSWPYRLTVALATSLYGFFGLWISFHLACRYIPERWAALATIGIWAGSSLPVYMYFNPSWSHALSVFVVALFLWYWHQTRPASGSERTWKQWIVLGLLSGLMVNVYYINALVMLVPALEALEDYWRAARRSPLDWLRAAHLLLKHAVYLVTFVCALLPTLITRQIIYGHPLRTGYESPANWAWASPAIGQVLFSSLHGLMSWTPILILAVAGLFFLHRRAGTFGIYLLATFLVFLYAIASRPGWDGLSSYGNRFFVSLTPLFIFGLAAFLDLCARWFANVRRATLAAWLLIGVFAVWNAGFIFQWGMHLIPVREAVSWREVAHNQVTVVPVRMAGSLKAYLVRRGVLMQQIEQKDLEQLRQEQKP